jgi:transposase
MVVRARIVLAAAEGARNVDIAKQVGVCVDVASKWRKRFCQQGLDGLLDLPRSGRPRTFGSEVVAGIKALACEPPEARDVPLSRWSSLELAAQAVTEGLVEAISSSTVRRSTLMRSNPGATGLGSSPVTLTSPPRRLGSSTSMRASLTAWRSAPTTT